MINTKLLQVIWLELHDFDPTNKDDIIKAEKILKAKNKLDSSINLNDIEICIQFFNQFGSKFMPLLKDKNIQAILSNDVKHFNGFPCILITADNETITNSFGELFTEDIYGFISKCLKENAFFKINDLFKSYTRIISFDVMERVREKISSMNSAVMTLLNDPTKHFNLFTQSNFRYAINSGYYRLQSQVDSFYFEEDILTITNIIAEKQKSSETKKIGMGRVLIALAGFESENPTTVKLLESNREIGQSWIDIQEGTTTNDSNYLVYFVIALVVIGFVIFLAVSSGINSSALRLVILPIILILRLINFFNKK